MNNKIHHKVSKNDKVNNSFIKIYNDFGSFDKIERDKKLSKILTLNIGRNRTKLH